MSLHRSLLAVGVSLALVGCAAESRRNVVSAEREPLVSRLAPPETAFTLAQIRRPEGGVHTLLVTAYEDAAITAVDLARLGASDGDDPFEALASVSEERLAAARNDPGLQERVEIASLLPSAAPVDRHLASGTNFPEHAEEAGSEKVFNFPKFGLPSPAITTVRLKPGVLLDYEVEICARFDRDIRSVADFDAARKGFFLCGDFTDRATLVRLIDRDDVGSGQGFSDAKSGPDFFPTGPFLVVPRDWKAFVASERIITRVNGELRQDARGGEMTLDFRGLMDKALTRGGGGRYVYRGQAVPLLPGEVLPRGATLMSGTSEGVIFMPPTRGHIAAGVARFILTGPMLRGEPAFPTIAESFIAAERRAGRYLKVGDRVEHAASTLGALQVTVVPGD